MRLNQRLLDKFEESPMEHDIHSTPIHISSIAKSSQILYCNSSKTEDDVFETFDENEYRTSQNKYMKDRLLEF